MRDELREPGAAPRGGTLGTIGIKGFPLTSRMREGLEHIDLRDLAAPASGRGFCP